MVNSRLLKTARVRAGFTQKQLAKAIDMGETSYTKRENGIVDFTSKEIIRIVKALKLSDTEIQAIFFNNEVAFKTTKKPNVQCAI